MSDSLPHATTQTLIDRAAGGSREASEVLYARYFPRLTAWAHGRLPNYARGLKDTNDLIQEALTGAVARVQVFQQDHDRSFLHYVRKSILNGMLNQIHHAQVEHRFGERETPPTPKPRTPMDDLIDRETLDRYEKALATLSGVEQDLVISRLEFDMSYKDIALHTGHPSADAARMAVARAIQKLAVCMATGDAGK